MSHSQIPVATAISNYNNQDDTNNTRPNITSATTATVFPEVRLGDSSLPTATIANISSSTGIQNTLPMSQRDLGGSNIPQAQYPIAIAEAYPYLQPQQRGWVFSAEMTEPIPQSYYLLVLGQKLSKTIQFFSVLDTVLCLINLFVYPYIAISVIFPILGYYGAKNYQTNKLYAYSFFIMVLILGRAAVLSFNMSAWAVLITGINWIVEFWILRMVCRLIDIIKKLPEEQIQGLRQLNYHH